MDNTYDYGSKPIDSPLYNHEWNDNVQYDINSIASPLYEPKSPLNDDYEPMQFKYNPTANEMHTVVTQNKIYGEEYGITSVLQAPTQANNLKIEQPKFEILSVTNTKKYQQPTEQQQQQQHESTLPPLFDTSLDELYNNAAISINKQPQPIPTRTSRNYINFQINHLDIPELCTKCYSIKCFCTLIQNLQI